MIPTVLPYFAKAGLTWVAATTAFGLLPLWLRLFGSAMTTGNTFDAEGILKEGMLAFFSMAIVSAVTVDYFLSSRRYKRFVELYTVILFPSMIYILTLALYFFSLGAAHDAPSQNRFLVFEVAITIVACIYAGLHKMAHYYREGVPS